MITPSTYRTELSELADASVIPTRGRASAVSHAANDLVKVMDELKRALAPAAVLAP